MNATPALESIAGMLPSLPDESVEGMLVTFDTLAGISGDELRPAAAQLLRSAAASCQNPPRRDRLLSAAEAVAAGRPCALTADGLTWQQAAAAQTVTQEEWEKRVAEMPEPPPPDDIEAIEESEASEDANEPEEEEAEDSPYMEEEPPKLPHLRIRQFFPGLVVRVGRDFADAHGRAVCSGEVLKLLAFERVDDGYEHGYALTFLDRNVRLSESVAGHDAIIENAANAWFQPAPTAGCLEDLLEAIDLRLSEVESDMEEEDDDAKTERIEAIREDVERCANWLARSGERGPAPNCSTGPLAAKVFGRNHVLTALVPFLYAAVAVCMPDL